MEKVEFSGLLRHKEINKIDTTRRRIYEENIKTSFYAEF
jgi:hypothetical protein